MGGSATGRLQVIPEAQNRLLEAELAPRRFGLMPAGVLAALTHAVDHDLATRDHSAAQAFGQQPIGSPGTVASSSLKPRGPGIRAREIAPLKQWPMSSTA